MDNVDGRLHRHKDTPCSLATTAYHHAGSVSLVSSLVEGGSTRVVPAVHICTLCHQGLHLHKELILKINYINSRSDLQTSFTWIESSCPSCAAVWSGVHPLEDRALTSAPTSSSTCIACNSILQTAIYFCI